jgi:hypothetical protein
MSEDQCREVLKMTNLLRVDTIEQRMAYLWSIQTEDEYHDGAGGALNVLFGDVPVGASFDQFKDWRNKVTQQLDYQSSDFETHQLVTSFIPAAETEAWLGCVQINNGGLEISAADISDDMLTATITWIPPDPGTGHPPPPVKIHITTFVGGTIVGDSPLPAKDVQTKWVKNLTIKRSTDTDLRLTVNVGAAYTKTLVLPKAPTYVTQRVISLNGPLAGADLIIPFACRHMRKLVSGCDGYVFPPLQ